MFSDIVRLIIIFTTARISQFIHNYFHFQIKHNCKLMINWKKKLNWWLIGRTDSVDSRSILHFWRITDIYILIKKKTMFFLKKLIYIHFFLHFFCIVHFINMCMIFSNLNTESGYGRRLFTFITICMVFSNSDFDFISCLSLVHLHWIILWKSINFYHKIWN